MLCTVLIDRRFQLKLIYRLALVLDYKFTDSKTDCDICDETIAQLESIDDDAEAVGVRVIQTDDEEFIEEYGITEFPAVIYFENEDPSIYDGTYKIDLKK